MSKLWTRPRLLIAAILLGSVTLAALMIGMRPEPPQREAPPSIPFANTEPVVAGSGAIPVHGAGTVRPRAEISVSVELGGRVVWVNDAFQSGGRIAAGTELFRLDETALLNRVEAERANVVIREVDLVTTEQEADAARAEYERFRSLQTGAASDDAHPLALWEPQLRAGEAALSQARAALAIAERDVGLATTRAPFDGVVRSESVDVGQYVAPGQAVGRMFATDAVEVVVPLSDADAALLPGLWDLRAGRDDGRITARVEAEYGKGTWSWTGYVDRAEASLDEQTRTIVVIVRVPDPFSAGVPTGGEGALESPPLLVGKFVEVEIEGVAPDHYFRLRRAALRPGNEVWAVEGGETLTLTIVPVKVLQSIDDQVWVTGALEPGQPVVVNGIEIAVEGMQVRTAAAENR